MFQSTHPRGVRHKRPAFTISSGRFQSTHPRGVRRAVFSSLCRKVEVSIHAPAWGATPARPTDCDECRVSIHAPAWGATSQTSDSPAFHPRFNPRTRVGCDLLSWMLLVLIGRFQSTHPRGVRRVMDPEDYANIWVSIHAPAWGATRQVSAVCVWSCSFNPRTRVGCDISSSMLSMNPAGFQSTHPRGVRRIGKRLPRVNKKVSIHAPAWGATGKAHTTTEQADEVSIHAPAWGATVSMFYPVDSRD